MTHHKYTIIDLDKSVTVRFLTLYKNNLTLYFKFFDESGNPVDVSNMYFQFTVTDVGKTVNVLTLQNSNFIRPATNEIKYVENTLDVIPDIYKVDFTVTFADGRVQTLMDGEFIVRERYIYNG